MFGDDIVLFESDAESNSYQGSNIKRGDDPKVSLAGATEYVGLSTQRVNEAVKPEATLELDLGGELEQIEAGLVVVSWPSGGILKENLSSAFKEFDMLKLWYMYQILSSIEIRAPLPHKLVN